MPTQPTTPGATRLVIVDPRPICRAGLRALLETGTDVRVVGEAASAEAGISLVDALAPQIVVVSEDLPDARGLELAWRIRRHAPATHVLLHCTRLDSGEWTIVDALKHGVAALVPADASACELREALDTALQSRCTISLGSLRVPAAPGDAAARWVGPVARRVGTAGLSAQQTSLLNLVLQGLSNAEIARLMTMSSPTIAYYVSSVLRRLAEGDEPAEVEVAPPVAVEIASAVPN